MHGTSSDTCFHDRETTLIYSKLDTDPVSKNNPNSCDSIDVKNVPISGDLELCVGELRHDTGHGNLDMCRHGNLNLGKQQAEMPISLIPKASNKLGKMFLGCVQVISSHITNFDSQFHEFAKKFPISFIVSYFCHHFSQID
jgi:hypothetical protein